ncbi:hypothetical protein XH80_00675 [Bradyrhizobium sp. CCBAU 45384]|nr:hypothetical protein [Bradyrhizobium sp. CCBAU 45384]
MVVPVGKQEQPFDFHASGIAQQLLQLVGIELAQAINKHLGLLEALAMRQLVEQPGGMFEEVWLSAKTLSRIKYFSCISNLRFQPARRSAAGAILKRLFLTVRGDRIAHLVNQKADAALHALDLVSLRMAVGARAQSARSRQGLLPAATGAMCESLLRSWLSLWSNWPISDKVAQDRRRSLKAVEDLEHAATDI